MQRQPTEKRRRQIAEAALKLIAEQGLGRFTTAAIAAEIGLSEGSLFRHFGNKKEIVDAAVERVEELLTEPAAPEAGDPIDELSAFFHRRIELMRRHPGVFRVLFSDQLAQAASPETVARIDAVKQRSLAFVRDRVERAVAQGLTRPGVGAAELFVIVHGAALSLAFSGAQPRRGDKGTMAEPDRVWAALESMIRK